MMTPGGKQQIVGGSRFPTPFNEDRADHTSEGVANHHPTRKKGVSQIAVPSGKCQIQNQIQIFKHPKFGTVRCFTMDGKPWFVGKDVTDALGYSNPRDALSKHCRYVAKCDVPHPQAKGKTITMSCIPEGDMYRLAAHSHIPGAEEFESWIFDEVLPTVREHGTYMTPETIEKVLADPDTIIRLATDLKEARAERDKLAKKNEALAQENASQRMMLAEASPKASYYDVVLQTPDLISISKIAKDYGKSPQWMNQYLKELGIQYKQGGIWLLYQKYAEQGYTKSKTSVFADKDGRQHSSMSTYWTQKGRLFIYDLLKQNGIVPLIEREKTA